MFEYSSEQVRTSIIDGKGSTKVYRVHVNNSKGTKEVIEKNLRGKTLRKSRKPLKKSEIYCIRKCQFIPGLFRDCEKCLRNTRKHR